MASGRTSQTGRLAALIGALWALALGSRWFIPVDETRYMALAWHMWQRGDLLVPWLGGEPYAHKPPLLFWLVHAGWAVFGVNDISPRLISPLAAAGVLALTAGLARRLWPADEGVAARSAWLLAACALWVVFSTATMFDMLLTGWVLVGLHGVVSLAQGRARAGVLMLAVGIGGGLLTKGPMVLLQLLPVTVLWRWWATEAATVSARRWAAQVSAAIAGGMAIALLWAMPAALQGGPAYRAAIFWGQTAGRMVDAFDHARPVWWYLPLLPALVFPWSVWPPAWRAMVAALRGPRDLGLRFVLAWAVPVLALLSLVSGKQIHYLLPILPALALGLARVLGQAGPALRSWDALPAAAVLAIVGAAVPAASLWRSPGSLAPWLADISPAWALLPLGLAALIAADQARRPPTLSRRLPALAAQMALAMATLGALVFQAAGPAYDPRPVAAQLAAHAAAGAPLAWVEETDHASFDFAARLREPLQPVAAADLEAWFVRHPRGVALWLVPDSVWDASRPALAAQPFRGKHVVLVDAPSAPAWVAAIQMR